jgi:hypothetical protein
VPKWLTNKAARVQLHVAGVGRAKAKAGYPPLILRVSSALSTNRETGRERERGGGERPDNRQRKRGSEMKSGTARGSREEGAWILATLQSLYKYHWESPRALVAPLTPPVATGTACPRGDIKSSIFSLRPSHAFYHPPCGDATRRPVVCHNS